MMLNLPMSAASSLADLRQRPKRLAADCLDNVPDMELTEWSTKLFLLMNLAWSYVDTVCDLSIQQKLEGNKKDVREIRNLKREYDRFRHRFIDSKCARKESEQAEWFESVFASDFDRLFNTLELEAGRNCRCDDFRALIVSVQQAMTLIEAVLRFARYCDSRIKGYGAWTCDCCMVQSEFLKLPEVLRRFPDCEEECYKKLRQTSARILENRLHCLTIGKSENKLWIKAV